jgi:hypothetical protein
MTNLAADFSAQLASLMQWALVLAFDEGLGGI